MLNLVGYNLFAGNDAGDDARLVRNKEIFQRSVHEATGLAEQLAHYVDNYLQGSDPIPNPGKVVRLLQSLPRWER